MPYNPNLKENSQTLRKAENLSEVLLWKILRADGFNGYSFYRQKPILNYIADFYCKELRLVIEIDGYAHSNEEAQKYDAERDRQMQALGLTVLRIKDEAVKKDMESVLKEIEATINNLVKTSPKHFSQNATDKGKMKEQELVPLKFSAEATAVFDAGRDLWKYYHAQKDANVNASFYDIRAHFQGRNNKGRMNSKSEDTVYMGFVGALRNQLNILAEKIQPKVYEYGFLKE